MYVYMIIIINNFHSLFFHSVFHRFSLTLCLTHKSKTSQDLIVNYFVFQFRFFLLSILLGTFTYNQKPKTNKKRNKNIKTFFYIC